MTNELADRVLMLMLEKSKLHNESGIAEWDDLCTAAMKLKLKIYDEKHEKIDSK